MHSIVVGCGRLGSELAVALEAGGHTVSIIDKRKTSFQRYLPEHWTGRAVVGFGFDRDALDQAGIKEASAVAAVTGGDNSNILAARIAKETFQIPNVVARIQDPRRAVLYQQLGIQTVATVSWATEQVMRRLFPSESVAEWTDATGALKLVERAIPEAWAGRKLAELGEAGRFRLVGLTRGGEARLTGPDAMGQEGDRLHLMVTADAQDDLDERLASGPSS
ncbi:MAG: TrkA family potassium uptake protein [Actinobacteria bacterium]|nr:TrkA family potassium uptake protein [Actinomycetota bacterium]